ncbi:MAG: hypothetical protein KGK02_09575 [Rhodospirillales bacterium]|nr:hypothetical protein [Rhodospirillales bacterium]
MPQKFNALAQLRAYAAHNDPATAMANTVALSVGGNMPFYPLYMLVLLGRHVFPLCLLTSLATPAFLVIPWLSRRSSRWGRAGLPIIGTLNTMWCLKLLGARSGVGLFLFPCILLAALLFRPGERWLCLGLSTLTLLLYFLSPHLLGAPVIPLGAVQAHTMSVLNAASVATLTWLLAVLLASLLEKTNHG